jgi:HTH-type transcriptional regulator/antitoxin HigA
MAEKKQHTSRDLLIHPGEYLAEIIEERGYSQKELAIRTGVTEKHISSVINGKSNITNEFAQKLAIALNTSSTLWINLQANYDSELFYIEQNENITIEERKTANEIKNLVEIILGYKLNSKQNNEDIHELRRVLGLNNLTILKNIQFKEGNYNLSTKESLSDIEIYIYQYLLEQKARNQNVDYFYVERLKKKIHNIKKLMFEKNDNIIHLLQEELNGSGVYFLVSEQNKLPIDSVTFKTKTKRPLIALTYEENEKDKFWFDLFYEIGQIILRDFNHTKINNEMIKKLDKEAKNFANNALTDSKIYRINKLCD